MRRLLTLCMLLALAVPARAHFIWLVPDADGKGHSAQLVFSDTLGPDEAVLISKVAQTKLFARAGLKGADVPVTMTPQKHSYRVTVKATEGPILIGGICQYGVLARGKSEPFLLMYYPKLLVKAGATPERGSWVSEGTERLPLEIVPVVGTKPQLRVLWRGKPAAGVEVSLVVPGHDDAVEAKTDAQGLVAIVAPKADGTYGVRAKHIEKKAGALNGKKYAEVRHYATLTFPIAKRLAPKTRRSTQSVSFIEEEKGKSAPDAAATKLLADARAARAVWRDFPGFRADLEVNDNGKLSKGKFEVNAKGKVVLRLDGADDATRQWARRELLSLVAHRLPGGPMDTPCAFADDVTHHPQGRLIRILNDELHSVYRIRDREIIEVHRRMKDVRFTISVLANVWNAEKNCLPACYVVNSWDLKKDALVSATAHHNTWQRIGSYDLPASLLVVDATPARLGSRRIVFTNVRLSGANPMGRRP